ncbi:hypothetical protein [Amycolatopsis sp. NBC_00438]
MVSSHRTTNLDSERPPDTRPPTDPLAALFVVENPATRPERTDTR